MKANFRLSKNEELKKVSQTHNDEKKELTEEEFEDFMVKSGAAGSFMVFRSDRSKDDELGLDEL